VNFLFIYFLVYICILNGFRWGWKGSQFTFVEITREKAGVYFSTYVPRMTHGPETNLYSFESKEENMRQKVDL
jgi:hypothetical protein